jgi:hypothetical protein
VSMTVPMAFVPKTGPRAHDTSRELEFSRPARVGATPVLGPAAIGPRVVEYSRKWIPFGDEKK